jgi:hypothetical protein
LALLYLFICTSALAENTQPETLMLSSAESYSEKQIIEHLYFFEDADHSLVLEGLD